MSYWVLSPTMLNDGAIIEKLPKEVAHKFDLYEAISVRETFPHGGVMAFSPNFPDNIRVFDFVGNTMALPIISGKVRQVFKELGIDKCELLRVTLHDHKGRVASEDHCIVNVLDVQDIIDMERSEYDLSAFDPSQISHIKRLVLKTDGIDPKALLFRARTCMQELFIHDRLREALVQAGVTGLRVFEAEGWDGFDL